MKTLLEMAAADWGRPLERTARAAGAVLALVIALVLIAGDGLVAVARLAHVALLERSDQLAVLVVRLVAPEHRRPALAALASLPAPAAAAPTPPALAALTVAALRRRARNRGLAAAGGRPVHKARRADLLEALAIA